MSSQLPPEPIQRLTKPFLRFLKIEATGGAILLLVTIAALILSNSPWSSQYFHFWEITLGIHAGPFEMSRSIREWINDGAMTLFFFVVAMELKRELVLGELKAPRLAAFSIAGALGGMLVPAALYLALQFDPEGERGWGVVMSTDTAFLISCLVLLGKRIPRSLYIFLLSLAVIDDIGAILVIAIGYSKDLVWEAIVIALLGIALVKTLSLLGMRSVAVYFLLGGLIWIAVDISGIHATITGVILGLMTPAHPWVSDRLMHSLLNRVTAFPLGGNHWAESNEDRQILNRARIAAHETLSPIEHLESALHPWVSFGIMPIFAFANAGVTISLADVNHPVAFAVLIGFVFGKPIGIFALSWLSVSLGIATRPKGLRWSVLFAGSLLAGIGFTMALFIADLAFDGPILDAAKIGILAASSAAALLGIGLLMWLCPRPSSSAA